MPRKISCLIPALLLICCLGAAWATPMAEVTYLETVIGGTWQYEFTVKNTSDPVIDAGFGIFDVLLDLSSVPGISLISSALPNDWGFLPGPGFAITDFIEIYSEQQGLPPAGADIAPGESLGGFVFQFDAKLANILFETAITDPENPNEPYLLSDLEAKPDNAVPIPEPATLALISIGLGGVGLYTRRKRIH